MYPLLGFEDYEAQPVDSGDLQSAWLTLKGMAFASKVLDRSVVRYYQGRKGIEPAGAKGVYILREPVRVGGGLLRIENDISRQRRMDVVAKGVNVGNVGHIWESIQRSCQDPIWAEGVVGRCSSGKRVSTGC